MSVRIFYIDESYDERVFCLTAISIRHTQWRTCFEQIKQHRRLLQREFGIPLTHELHARDLIGGRGNLGPQPVPRYRRAGIFKGALEALSKLPSVKLFNVCLNCRDHVDVQLVAWDRMINRIERTMRKFDEDENSLRTQWVGSLKNLPKEFGEQVGLSQNGIDELCSRLTMFRSRALIIADEGREREIVAAYRRMNVHNYIPSKRGQWEDGKRSKNIVAQRIIEDPFFKKSERSYFLQLADLAAYALLKRETAPTKRVKKYNIHRMFDAHLGGICYKRAAIRDLFGIVRK